MFSHLIKGYKVFGFSGSRSCPSSMGAALGLLGYLPRTAHIYVGCASGVDACIRAASRTRPHPPTVFSVAPLLDGEKNKGLLVRRSMACVQAVACVRGLWCSFPSIACPSGVFPSQNSNTCFCGSGSGSWASLAYAVGSGCAALICMPAGIPPPYWVSRRALTICSLGGDYLYLSPQELPSIF